MAEKLDAKNKQGVFTPFHIDEVPWDEFTRGKFGMRYKQLGEFGGATQLGICYEELAPGMQANQAHYHLAEEEHLYMLEGELTVGIGENTYQLKPGYYVCFPAGQQQAHTLLNKSDNPCRYLIFSNRNPNDVIIYPDSDKVNVRSTGEIYQKSKTLDYWENAEE